MLKKKTLSCSVSPFGPGKVLRAIDVGRFKSEISLSDFVNRFTEPVASWTVVADQVIVVPAGSRVLDTTATDLGRLSPDNLCVVTHAVDVPVEQIYKWGWGSFLLEKALDARHMDGIQESKR